MTKDHKFGACSKTMSVASFSDTVYINDGENTPLCVGKCEFNGKTLIHSRELPNTVHALESLKSYAAKEDDIWLISYPKSGTHWVFEILGILLSGTLEPLESYKHISFVESRKDTKDIPTLCGRRVYNTHLKTEYLPKDILNKCKVIYVARNPKSVAVSFYKQVLSMKSLKYCGTFNGYLPLFLEGFYNIWGSWFDHVREYWTEGKNNKNMIVLFYEELKKDTCKLIYQLSQWLGLDHTKEFCEQVAELASLENMRKATGKSEEQKEIYYEFWKGNEIGFFRRGRIDDWKNAFTVAQNEAFDKIYKDKMMEYPDLKERIQFL